MKSAAFIDAMAHVLGVPHKTMVTYTRFLKEAGLLTTGARGVNAPHMTPMDAARVTIALLTCDTPSQAVDRVRRFGQIPYTPDFTKTWIWYENLGQSAFEQTFEGNTFEEVLAFMFGRVGELGVEGAAAWFQQHTYSVRVNDFFVLAELVAWRVEGEQPVGEVVVPFKGDPMSKDFPKITGVIRTTREMADLPFFEVGFQLAEGVNKYPGFDSKGYPIWGRD